MTRKTSGYKALVAALVIFTVSIFISSFKLLQEHDRITQKFIPNLWVAANAQIELLRFLDALHSYVHDEDASSDELGQRLHILWSRLPLLVQGSESDHVRAVDGAVEVIADLEATLERLEPVVLDLGREDRAAYRAIHAELARFRVPMQQIVGQTMLKDESVAARQREDIRRVYWTILGWFGGIILSAVVLVGLLFREFREVRKLLGVAHEAEAAATAARGQLRAVIDAVPARINAKDRDGGYLLINRYEADLLGVTPEQAVGRSVHELEPEEVALAERRDDHRVLDRGAPLPLFEQEITDRAGEQRIWLTTKVPLTDGGGRPSGVVTVALDITQQKEAQRMTALLATAVEHAGDAIEITDAQGRFQYVNSAFERIFGYARAEAIGETPFTLLMHRESDEPEYQAVQRALERGEVWQGQLVARRKDGSRFHQEATISPVIRPEGQITHFVAVKRDISDRIQAQQKIWHLAHHDPLTGLPNRMLFQDRLDQAALRARRDGQLAAVLFIDLDDFKDVNDSLGHEVGDALLKAVTARLLATTADTDTVARLGGDEFAIIQGGLADAGGAARLAERVLEALGGRFVVGEHEITVSASIGITLYPRDDEDPARLLRNADMAMYRAKTFGPGGYQFFVEDMQAAYLARKSLERDLRVAVEQGALELHYQPLVAAAGGRLVAAEALLRWQHPEHGAVSPAEFVPIAEESGLIVPLTRWVLDTACAQAAEWRRMGLPELRMAVNLSPVQFLDKDMVGSIAAACARHDLAPALLEVEITESVLLRDTVLTRTLLQRLADLGVGVALDDFGTGYSSMSYLKRFPVTKVKIDRAFVAEVTKDEGDAAIVKAVIGLAHGLGLRVTAEGVETPAQASVLRAYGCDELQGFLFGRPMPAQQFAFRLRRAGLAEAEGADPGTAGALA
jgi:diguanylate cyclase (GGDEF)-like protein/PAS domain S-box-containing protein